jgi:hypothetical protein
MPLATQRFKIPAAFILVASSYQHGINLAANFKALLNNKPLTAFI